MGLDAVVYRNRENLSPEYRSLPVNESTGEVYRENGINVPGREAISFRLGNIARIADLRAELMEICEGVAINAYVLHDGFSGGVITHPNMDAIRDEVGTLRKADVSRYSPSLRELLDQLDLLLEAAARERNPIVLL
jgi:hypothetical protein